MRIHPFEQCQKKAARLQHRVRCQRSFSRCIDSNHRAFSRNASILRRENLQAARQLDSLLYYAETQEPTDPSAS